MDFRELVLTRRTVHAYTTEKIDDRLVEEALALSLWAPNHKLTFPWAYTWVGPEARARLADLSVELKSARGGMNEVKAAALRAKLMEPSHLIILGRRLHDGSGRAADEATAREDFATIACGVQTLSLFLWQHGVSTKWSTSGWSTHARAYAILDVDPAEVRLEGAVMIGRARLMPQVPERPRLENVLRKIT